MTIIAAWRKFGTSFNRNIPQQKSSHCGLGRPQCVWRWRVSNHERFEELCVMAAAGEISVSEQRELMAHIEQCVSCRKTFADMKDIHSMWLPQREGVGIKRSFAAESKLRQRIVQRVAAAGAQFSSEALLPADAAALLTRPSYQSALHRLL